MTNKLNPDKYETYTNASDKEIVEKIIHSIERQQIPLLGELMIRLKESIDHLEKTSSKLTKQMLYLTWILVFLNIIAIVLVFRR